MKKVTRSYNLVLGAVLALVIGVTSAATGAETKTAIFVDGQELYRRHCAVCHGVDAKGAGPAAEALKKHPSDLTLLQSMNGGKFPALSVQLIIKGANTMVEHGTREMPIWGPVFSDMGQNRELGDTRVLAVLKYLEHIQAR